MIFLFLINNFFNNISCYINFHLPSNATNSAPDNNDMHTHTTVEEEWDCFPSYHSKLESS